MATEEVSQAPYAELFGFVPDGIKRRIAIAERADRAKAVSSIENLRAELIANNPLPREVQQLVHFGQLVALCRAEPAHCHAEAALKAGASIRDLLGVVETALITSGMPAYQLGINILHDVCETKV